MSLFQNAHYLKIKSMTTTDSATLHLAPTAIYNIIAFLFCFLINLNFHLPDLKRVTTSQRPIVRHSFTLKLLSHLYYGYYIRLKYKLDFTGVRNSGFFHRSHNSQLRTSRLPVSRENSRNNIVQCRIIRH